MNYHIIIFINFFYNQHHLIITVTLSDTGNSLSEVEKKLLLLCQSQATANTEKTTDENNTSSAQDDFSASTQPQDQPIENGNNIIYNNI